MPRHRWNSTLTQHELRAPPGRKRPHGDQRSEIEAWYSRAGNNIRAKRADYPPQVEDRITYLASRNGDHPDGRIDQRPQRSFLAQYQNSDSHAFCGEPVAKQNAVALGPAPLERERDHREV